MSQEYKITIDIEIETGAYEVTLHNTSHPGQGIYWSDIKPMLAKILAELDYKVDTAGEA